MQTFQLKNSLDFKKQHKIIYAFFKNNTLNRKTQVNSKRIKKHNHANSNQKKAVVATILLLEILTLSLLWLTK